MTYTEQIADALILIAKANHYMVGFVASVSEDDLAEAEQILINRQNAFEEMTAEYETIGLALDMIEQKIIRIVKRRIST